MSGLQQILWLGKLKLFTIMPHVREFAISWDRAVNGTVDKGVGSNNSKRGRQWEYDQGIEVQQGREKHWT